MGIGSLQKALAMQCGGILHLTQDELTIIVFPIKVFSKKIAIFFTNAFYVMITSNAMVRNTRGRMRRSQSMIISTSKTRRNGPSI